MKNLLIIALTVLGNTVLGQVYEETIPFDAPAQARELPLTIQKTVPKRTYGDKWFNLHSDLVDLFFIDGSTTSSPVYALPIFPDSTIYWAISETSSEPISAWIHGAGDIINPALTPGNWIDKWGEVVIDSIDIWNSYIRNTDDSVVDTLFIDFIKSVSASAYFDFNSNNTADVGEFSHQPILYNQPKNEVTSTQVFRRDTIYLTKDDTSSNISSLYLDVNDTVQGTDRYGIYVSYQPGFTWVANNDTLEKYNTFNLITREQSSEAYPTQFWSVESGFSSYVLPVDVRYNTSTTFNGFIVPTIAYGDSWAFEHHYFWYKLTSNELGVKNVNPNIGNVGTFPNPASNETNVSFDLVKSADVVLRITDISGKLIEQFELGKLNPGNHIQKLDLAKYQNGNYTVSINGSAKIITVVK